jgi:anthranilate/para-aminobenzoate synthase component II
VKKILLVDNYDSFVFNLKALCESLEGVCITVMRNDDPFIELLAEGRFDGLIISPGPGSPDDVHYFGQCMTAIKEVGPSMNLPILGVCLGFQGIAHAFGCTLKRALLPMHGKVSPLKVIQPSVILQGVNDGSMVMRYHSLMIDMAKPDAKVNMIFKPSETVDFSRFKYDLVFTSPPYFMIEVYQKMPSYDGKIAFLDTFFRPVVEKAWKSLAIGGHMALNMPVEMYEAVRRCLAPLATKLELALAVRHAGSDRVKKPYREYIYVWKKLASKRSVTCKRGNIKGGVVRLLTRKQPTH